MKNTIVLAAVAGIASAAAAQNGSLSIIPSVTTIDSTVSTSFTIAIYASADFGTHIAGGAFGLSNAGGAGIVTDMTVDVVAWASAGTTSTDRGHNADGDYEGLVFGQPILPFPPFNLFPDAASSLAGGGVLIANFAVTIAAGSEGVIDWSTRADTIATFVLSIYNEADLSQANIDNGNFAGHGSAQVNVVPAPSAMALLGLGGLVAGRRRR